MQLIGFALLSTYATRKVHWIDCNRGSFDVQLNRRNWKMMLAANNV